MQIKPWLRLKIVKHNGCVHTIISRKKSRFLSNLQAIPESAVALYKLSVSYGRIANNEDKQVAAKNEGDYATRQSLLFAFRIFTDPKEIRAIID